MQKLLVPLVLALVLVAAPARAELFTLTSYEVSLHTSDPGLVVYDGGILNTPTSFTLDDEGDDYSTTLFRIGTTETALNEDDVKPYGIKVKFQFSRPLPGFGGNVEGITGAAWFFKTFGYVAWDNPAVLRFGNYGRLGISLEHETFSLPGSARVDVKFTLLKKDGGSSPPVGLPEPSSAVLLGLGGLMTALRRRVIS
jgi:hypothetical protein